MSDDELNASFDAAMRDTLDADQRGPAQIASEDSLRAAYANWRPFRTPSVSAQAHAGQLVG